MQSPFLLSLQKSSSQPEGEYIKKHKGKKTLYLEEARIESTDEDSDNETYVTRSMVESSRIKKKIEEEAKAEVAKHESEVRKEEFIDLLSPDAVNKKGPVKLKLYREDGTNEIIPNLKASDLCLGEWREVMNGCPNRTGKGWITIYDQICTRVDYIHTTKAELGINLDIPLTNKRLKSSVQYEDHLAGTMINEPVLSMIMLNSYHRHDFVTIEDLKYFPNTMLYIVQEIFFKCHQGPGLDDYARTFSSLLLAKVDNRNLNPLKQMRVIK
ncbi:hypothetical protein Tco_0243300 [Tanacetum coccineum]